MDVEKEKPHILISYDEGVPYEIPQSIVDVIKHPNLKLVEEARESYGSFACMDWLLPTAVVVLVAKPYFDAFLKEMGKDHYHLLKKGILSVWDSLFSKNRQLKYVVVGTEGKIKSGNKYSMAFSVWAEINDQYKVKFLFEEQLTEEEFEKNVSLILQFLQAIYTAEDSLEDCIVKEDVKHTGKIVLVAFDKDMQKLRMVSPLPEIKQRNGQKV